MIASLRGVVIDRHLATSPANLTIEVADIGYQVLVTMATAVAHGIGDAVFVHVHEHIRDDAHVLYGFTDRSERATFSILLNTHGVGPAMALAILGTHDPGDLARIVSDRDLAALTLVPGVGKKTAERLLVELANRFDIGAVDGGLGTLPAGSVTNDVAQALVGLGYGTDEVREALSGLGSVAAQGDAAQLLKSALGVLGGRHAR